MSHAYQALEAALAVNGCHASATRLERWCYWRTGGLIDRPVRQGAGRGTRSAFPDLERAATQAATVARSLRPADRLDTLALRLHGQGFDLRAVDVKAAFIAELALLRRKFERDAGSSAHPVERAARAGWAAYRLFTRGQRARSRRESGSKTPSSRTWAIAGRVLLGEPIAAHDINQIIEDTPIGDALRLMLGAGPAEAAEAVAALAPLASFDALTEMLSARSPDSVAAAVRTAARFTAEASKWVPSLNAHADEGLRLGVALGLLANRAVDLAEVSEDAIGEQLRQLPAH